MGLLTTTCGWFPKPLALRQARWRHAEGEIELDALREVENAARAEALEQQQELGLDQLVDGQFERGDMVTHFAEALGGFEEGGLVRCFENRYYRKPRIVDAVARPASVTVEAFKAFKKAADGAKQPLKAILTGPYTLMDWSFDEHYGSREDCCMALAELMHDEVQALVEAGAQEIQIDEPAISARPDELPLVRRALERVTEPLAGKARSWTHVGYGHLGQCLKQVLALPVDGFLLELTQTGDEVVRELNRLPKGKWLAAGVIDVLSGDVESVDTIKQRAGRLLRRVPAERLMLAPDGGLRTLDPEAARAKLEAMVEAAASLG